VNGTCKWGSSAFRTRAACASSWTDGEATSPSKAAGGGGAVQLPGAATAYTIREGPPQFTGGWPGQPSNVTALTISEAGTSGGVRLRTEENARFPSHFDLAPACAGIDSGSEAVLLLPRWEMRPDTCEGLRT
jgi:hypothetical protein